MAEAAGVKLNKTSAGAGGLESSLLRDTCRLPESLTGVRAAWEPGGLWAVLACCVLQPRELRDRLSYPKTALPGTPNGEDGKAAHTFSHATRAHSTCYIPPHVCTHSMAHTLTRNRVVTSTCFHMQYTHTHDMLSHNMLPHETCSPIHVHVFKMCAHTLPIHTHSYSHMHTHGCLDTHRPTVTHLCPPLDAQTHPCTDRKTQAGPQRNKPRPHHTHDHLPKTHTTQEHTQEESYPVSHMDNPQKSTMHTGKDTGRATPATHTCLGAYTGSGVRTKSPPPALASTGPPTRWQVNQGAHPGQGYPDPGSSAVVPAQPSSLSPLQGPVKQHHQQIKSECAKIKPKGCDKAIPFPQDSALTQVLLSAINIFILILKDISITSLALDPARRYLACWAALWPHWAARG